MPRQLITDNFSIMLVIFDDKDAGGIRLALLRVAHRAGNLYSAVQRQRLSEAERTPNLPS
jgi:hypothetical protein